MSPEARATLLRFRDLITGPTSSDEISGVYYSSAWSTDSRTFFYTQDRRRHAAAGRSGATARPTPADDRLTYQEDDERFFVVRRPDPQRALS